MEYEMLNLEHKIESVTISLDTPKEYMAGIYRCNTVTSFDENGLPQDHPELIDNEEFHSIDELCKSVAEKLNVNSDIIDFE